MRKRRLDEHRSEAHTREHRPRPQLYLVLDNVRSLQNVGSLFRAADGFGVRKIFLGGITPAPPRPEIAKISLGAEKSVEYEWMEDPARAVVILKQMGVTVVAAEQTHSSVSLYDFPFNHPLALVFGHETVGIDGQVLSLCDISVEIPMFGAKHSHNVAVAAGVMLAEVRRQWQSGVPGDR
ncbi:MAG: RNA methyltransferase [Planctomycetota bacterium]